jgi:plasmid maintenance system antidote protein VapI
MKNSIYLFRKGIVLCGNASKLAKKMGMDPGQISRINDGVSRATEDQIITLAELVDEDPEIALITLQIEKATNKTRPVWRSILRKLLDRKGFSTVAL